MPKKFLRRQGKLLSKLGKRRRKKQKWRRPTGRDNKMREKRKGYSAVVSIGRKKPGKYSEKILIIRNPREIEKTKNKKIIIGKIGKRKKLEIEKIAKEKGIKILNLKKSKKKNESAK
jgi:large subunit ribosomal protein L32e